MLWQLGVVLPFSGLEWVLFYNSPSIYYWEGRQDKFNGAQLPVHVNLVSSLSYFHWGLRNRLVPCCFSSLLAFKVFRGGTKSVHERKKFCVQSHHGFILWPAFIPNALRNKLSTFLSLNIVCMHAKSFLSCLFVTLWTIAH